MIFFKMVASSRSVRLTVVVLQILLGYIAEVQLAKLVPRHFHQKLINHFSSEEAGCGVIPKVKIRERSRDPGISSFGQIPWQVGIFHQPENILICSGTLLASDLALTSAICLLGVENLSDLEVRLGDWDISKGDSPQESYDHFSASVSKAMFYPDGVILDESPMLALLVLKEPVDFQSYPHVAPVCLPPVTFLLERSTTEYCLVSGWGSTNRQISNSSDDQNDAGSSISPSDKLGDESMDDFYNELKQTIRITGHEPMVQTSSQFSSSLSTETNSIQGKTHENNSFKDNDLHTVSKPVYRSSDGNAKPFKLLDPVEDYLDENLEKDKDALAEVDAGNKNINFPQDHAKDATQDSSWEYKSPFLDSIYPISAHHEASLYRHKLKYKTGKMKGTKSRRISEDKHDSKTEIVSPQNKRSYPIHNEKRCSGKHRKRRLYQSHAEPEKATLLKLFQVKIHGNCDVSTGDSTSDELNTNYEYCISPTDGHYPMFPCMTDVGSPVFCTSSNSLRRETLGEESERRNREKSVSSRAYLIGFVSSWSTTCRDLNVPNSPGQHSKTVAMTPFTPEMLNFIYDNM